MISKHFKTRKGTDTDLPNQAKPNQSFAALNNFVPKTNQNAAKLQKRLKSI